MRHTYHKIQVFFDDATYIQLARRATNDDVEISIVNNDDQNMVLYMIIECMSTKHWFCFCLSYFRLKRLVYIWLKKLGFNVIIVGARG